jgi:hypothetical protein
MREISDSMSTKADIHKPSEGEGQSPIDNGELDFGFKNFGF